jgi:hypothetical protein
MPHRKEEFEADLSGWLEQLRHYKTYRCWLRGVAMAVLVAAWLSSFAKADTIVAEVDGRSNVFGAGHPVPPGGGLLPPSFRFPPSSGQYIEFSSVTGTVTYDIRIPRPFQGPDGGPHIAPTNVFSTGGISGIRHDDVTGFLVGVFLDDTEPMGAGPPLLNFTGATDFTDLFPALNQTFFIGDGLTGTGSGVAQRFHVPSGATRLFLGLADAWDGSSVTGPPGFYDDNGGSFTVTFTLVSSRVPVGGSVTGVDPRRVTCTNLTTRQTIVIGDRARSWDCEAAGLVVNPGDKIQQTITGRAD